MDGNVVGDYNRGSGKRRKDKTSRERQKYMSMADLFEDLPHGPLDNYRNQAKFDWKKMKMIFEDDIQSLSTKRKMWKILSQDPIFQKPLSTPTTKEKQKIAAKQLHRYLQYNYFSEDISSLPYIKRLKQMISVNEGLAMVYTDVSLKHGIGIGVFKNILTTLGTERHKHFLIGCWDGKVVGCIALTEIAHGSNTKQLKTTATFDKSTQEFVINTPNFEAVKCWMGNLGKTATLAIVFAQLITNNQNYGLHAFVVPIRCPKTLLPYSGITVGDIGEKIGVNGIDNGFMSFKNYRIPRENLLNRTSDILANGDYQSKFSEPGKVFGAALANLTLPRVCIIQDSVNSLIISVTIALRYSAVRRQFSDDNDSESIENPLIEYQLHQWRLFPYLAAAVVLKIFVNTLIDDYLNAVEKSENCEGIEEISQLVSEIHALVSGAKPFVTWTTMRAIQECREACGGHGYHKSARFGDLRNDNDPTVTYEGDNNVLQQQTSNWLLKQWFNLEDSDNVNSPLCTANFLRKTSTNDDYSSRKYEEKCCTKDLKYLMDCYEWLIAYLVRDIALEMERLQERGVSRFAAKNSVQVYRSAVLSKAYTELNILRYFTKRFQSISDVTLRSALMQMAQLFALHSLDQHIAYFYLGGFCQGPSMAKNLKRAILDLCQEVKPNVIGMVDALAPPDFVVDSVLGNSDGEIYKHLEKCLVSSKDCFERPEWWSEVLFENAPDFTQMQRSKL